MAKMNRESEMTFPTPRCNSLCGGTGAWDKLHELADGGRLSAEEVRAPSSTGGQLNPDWVEWLMGWPIGWTDLEAEEPGEWMDLEDDPAELPKGAAGYIPRVTGGRDNRANRIRALGNGQVPLCAAVAFEEGLRFLER
jgi:DNA (cytosine-5)-methyltransferase 1